MNVCVVADCNFVMQWMAVEAGDVARGWTDVNVYQRDKCLRNYTRTSRLMSSLFALSLT